MGLVWQPSAHSTQYSTQYWASLWPANRKVGSLWNRKVGSKSNLTWVRVPSQELNLISRLGIPSKKWSSPYQWRQNPMRRRAQKFSSRKNCEGWKSRRRHADCVDWSWGTNCYCACTSDSSTRMIMWRSRNTKRSTGRRSRRRSKRIVTSAQMWRDDIHVRPNSIHSVINIVTQCFYFDNIT